MVYFERVLVELIQATILYFIITSDSEHINVLDITLGLNLTMQVHIENLSHKLPKVVYFMQRLHYQNGLFRLFSVFYSTVH